MHLVLVNNVGCVCMIGTCYIQVIDNLYLCLNLKYLSQLFLSTFVTTHSIMHECPMLELFYLGRFWVGLMDHGSVLARQSLLAACFHLKSGKNPPHNQMGNDPFDDIGHLLWTIYHFKPPGKMPSQCYPSSSLFYWWWATFCFIFSSGLRSLDCQIIMNQGSTLCRLESRAFHFLSEAVKTCEWKSWKWLTFFFVVHSCIQPC